MYIEFKGSKIFYHTVGQGSATLFLCGWGYDGKILAPLAKNLGGKKIFVDFPMFGKSEGLKQDWTIFDYEKLVLKILWQEKIDKVKIVGHSFGGKVAILLAGKYNICERLVLIASAGVRPRWSLKRAFLIKKYKLARFLGKDTSGYGSEDYRALPQNAKKTFVGVVNASVLKVAKAIRAKTLIIAGKFDQDTPLYMQEKLQKKIENSTLKIFSAGHYVWVDAFFEVTSALGAFLQ